MADGIFCHNGRRNVLPTGLIGAILNHNAVTGGRPIVTVGAVSRPSAFSIRLFTGPMPSSRCSDYGWPAYIHGSEDGEGHDDENETDDTYDDSIDDDNDEHDRCSDDPDDKDSDDGENCELSRRYRVSRTKFRDFSLPVPVTIPYFVPIYIAIRPTTAVPARRRSVNPVSPLQWTDDWPQAWRELAGKVSLTGEDEWDNVIYPQVPADGTFRSLVTTELYNLKLRHAHLYNKFSTFFSTPADRWTEYGKSAVEELHKSHDLIHGTEVYPPTPNLEGDLRSQTQSFNDVASKRCYVLDDRVLKTGIRVLPPLHLLDTFYSAHSTGLSFSAQSYVPTDEEYWDEKGSTYLPTPRVVKNYYQTGQSADRTKLVGVLKKVISKSERSWSYETCDCDACVETQLQDQLVEDLADLGVIEVATNPLQHMVQEQKESLEPAWRAFNTARTELIETMERLLVFGNLQPVDPTDVFGSESVTLMPTPRLSTPLLTPSLSADPFAQPSFNGNNTVPSACPQGEIWQIKDPDTLDWIRDWLVTSSRQWKPKFE